MLLILPSAATPSASAAAAYSGAAPATSTAPPQSYEYRIYIVNVLSVWFVLLAPTTLSALLACVLHTGLVFLVPPRAFGVYTASQIRLLQARPRLNIVD